VPPRSSHFRHAIFPFSTQQGGPTPRHSEEVPTSSLCCYSFFHHNREVPTSSCCFQRDKEGGCLLVPIFDTARRYPPPRFVLISVFTTTRRYPPPCVVFDVTRRVGASSFPFSTQRGGTISKLRISEVVIGCFRQRILLSYLSYGLYHITACVRATVGSGAEASRK